MQATQLSKEAEYQRMFVWPLQEGWTALHLAAKEGHTKIIELLLEKSCNKELLAGQVCVKLWAVYVYIVCILLKQLFI